jgi:serine/threonine protein kinase
VIFGIFVSGQSSEWGVIPGSGRTVRSPRGYRYLLGERLGGGASGAVFDCVGPFDQSFALKVFQPAQQPYLAAREDWLREAERLYRLRHPNIVYVHDYFESEGVFFVVLERCDHSLEEMLGQPFTDRLVVDIARQLLFALQYLSDNEVVHNDLYGRVAVHPPIVHHRIMAPEVVKGGYSTKQSDLYQLGLLMYAMHTGDYPIDFAVGYDGVVEQIRQGEPRRRAETLGTSLGGIISVMLRRHEQYRYTSPASVWEELRRLDVWIRRPTEQ